MIDLDLAAELGELASAIARMRPPMNSNPEAFHEDRSELASRARQLAARAEHGAPIVAADVPVPIGRQVVRHETRHIEGRTILVLARRAVLPAPAAR